MKSLAEQIADLEDPAPPKELDPESHDVFGGLGDSGSEVASENEEHDAREHYETVSESKLRKPTQPKLGKRYEGTSVSRNALNGDEVDELGSEISEEESEELDQIEEVEDDGENLELDELDGEIDEDSEIDSEEAFGSGDDERFKDFTFSGSRRKDRQEFDEATDDGGNVDHDMEELDIEDEDEDLESEGSQDVEDMEDDLEQDDEDLDEETDATSEDSEAPPSKPAASSDRAVLRALMSADAKAVASSISAAADADAQKGRAVKEQYQTFDKLIDLRIKLQKGFAATNAIPEPSPETEIPVDPVQKAEEAALQLWSTLESLRHDFLDAQDSSSTSTPPNPKKRKRPSPATLSTPNSTLWSRTQSLESQSLPHRRSILNKWSARVRASAASAATSDSRSRLLNSTPKNNNITSVLDAYISTHQSPVLQSSYDDTPFYQSLLVSLINSRQTASSNNSAPTSNVILPSSSTRGAKLHRANLDTKASKGRKMRYTVHEKMLNFTAPEAVGGGGVGRWGDVQIDEFFASLFGGHRVLDESINVDDDEAAADAEEEGLRLFR